MSCMFLRNPWIQNIMYTIVGLCSNLNKLEVIPPEHTYRLLAVAPNPYQLQLDLLVWIGIFIFLETMLIAVLYKRRRVNDNLFAMFHSGSLPQKLHPSRRQPTGLIIRVQTPLVCSSESICQLQNIFRDSSFTYFTTVLDNF